DVEATRGHAGRDRRLQRRHLVRPDEAWTKSGMARRELRGQPTRAVDVTGDAEEPGRLGRQGEPLEVAIERDRFEVELDEHRIDRMLDHPRVPAGGAGADLGSLDEDD